MLLSLDHPSSFDWLLISCLIILQIVYSMFFPFKFCFIHFVVLRINFFSLPFSLIYYRINKQNKRLSIVQCSIHWIWFGQIVFFLSFQSWSPWWWNDLSDIKFAQKNCVFFLFVLIYLFIVFNVYVFTIILKSSSWYLWMEQRKKKRFLVNQFIEMKKKCG